MNGENGTCYYQPNLGLKALLDEDTLADHTLFPPEEIVEKSEVIRDLGADRSKYNKIWERVQAARVN